MSVLPLQHSSDDTLSKVIGGYALASHQVEHRLQPPSVHAARCENDLRLRGSIHVRLNHSRRDVHYVDVEWSSLHILYFGDALKCGFCGCIYTQKWCASEGSFSIVSGSHMEYLRETRARAYVHNSARPA